MQQTVEESERFTTFKTRLRAGMKEEHNQRAYKKPNSSGIISRPPAKHTPCFSKAIRLSTLYHSFDHQPSSTQPSPTNEGSLPANQHNLHQHRAPHLILQPDQMSGHKGSPAPSRPSTATPQSVYRGGRVVSSGSVLSLKNNFEGFGSDDFVAQEKHTQDPQSPSQVESTMNGERPPPVDETDTTPVPTFRRATLSQAEISQMQKDNATSFDTGLHELLIQYLPATLLAPHPQIRTNAEGTIPSILEMEVRHAIAQAARNVYHAHIQDEKKRKAFDCRYEELREKYFGRGRRVAREMRRVAKSEKEKEVVNGGADMEIGEGQYEGRGDRAAGIAGASGASGAGRFTTN